ncbi:MAG: efflux RND transporter periplasmic adaptor subunit [Pseudomonadota bacterium]|nr:efflux RND transporter periplasmic adaptor subunit [Pseudomonadota bacterium]MDP1572675.1 efflux RND transporter periplasmic adaptor subunit [Pseudomonadota bacterium]MDP1906548.1 efflux RND transporter periplasmic adaptor subunit [Pseudomonadota bacterium]
MMLRALLLTLIAGNALAADIAASLDWSGRVSLTLPVAGVLEQVNVQAGQTVKKDDLLAALNPILFKAGVAETRADLDRLTQEEADATRDLDRVTELYARTVSSTTELDAAKLRHARARAGLAAAQARMEKARRLLAESELRAPFDAVILARHGEPGLVITIPCQPAAVVSIARADEWLARASIEAAQAAKLRLGEEASVQVSGQTSKGHIRAITTQTEGRVLLDVALPRAPGTWAGQAATISLP